MKQLDQNRSYPCTLIKWRIIDIVVTNMWKMRIYSRAHKKWPEIFVVEFLTKYWSVRDNQIKMKATVRVISREQSTHNSGSVHLNSFNIIRVRFNLNSRKTNLDLVFITSENLKKNSNYNHWFVFRNIYCHLNNDTSFFSFCFEGLISGI